MQVGKENLPVADLGVLGLQRLLDLHHHVAGSPDIVAGSNRRTSGDIGIIRKRAAIAGGCLDDNVVAVKHELARASGRECDSVLVLLDLFDDTYAHAKHLRETITTGNP